MNYRRKWWLKNREKYNERRRVSARRNVRKLLPKASSTPPSVTLPPVPFIPVYHHHPWIWATMPMNPVFPPLQKRFIG
jgi:hypothetical protein